MDKSSLTRHVFICSCEDEKHQFILTPDPIFRDVCLSVHLSSYKNWWQRVKYAIRYIFVKNMPDDSAWDCCLLDKDGVERMYCLLKNFLSDIKE